MTYCSYKNSHMLVLNTAHFNSQSLQQIRVQMKLLRKFKYNLLINQSFEEKIIYQILSI